MKSGSRWWVNWVAAVALVGCAGSQAPAPSASSTLAEPVEPSGALLPEEQPDLNPVPAPGELFAVGRWRSPGSTVDTLMGFSGLPFDWRRLLEAKEPELAGLVALDAPVELAVAARPATRGRFDSPAAVFSVGLRSLDQAVQFIRDRGERLERTAAGVYRIQNGGAMSCAVAASLGPTPARFVCGGKPDDLDALLPYATRGLPTEQLPEADLVVELRAEPLRQTYGSVLRQLKSLGLPLQLRGLRSGSARFDRAAADAAHGLADELLALSQDVDRLTLSMDADAAMAELRLHLSTKFRSASSWTVQTLLESTRHAGAAPRLFWRLPQDAAFAAFRVGVASERSSAIRLTMAELVDGYLAQQQVPRRLRNQVVQIVQETYGAPGWTVYAYGLVDKSSAPGAADADRERVAPLIGWHLLGLETKPTRIKKYFAELAAAYRAPGFQRLLQTELRIARSDLPTLRSRRVGAARLAPGSVQYELRLPVGTLAGQQHHAPSVTKSKSLSVYLVVMPDGDLTWLGLSADRAALYDRLAGVRKKEASRTLEARAGLAALKREQLVGGGFVTLAGLVHSPLWRDVLQLDESSVAASAGLPHGGETPIVGRARVVDTPATSLELSLVLPKAVVQDAVAAAVAGGLRLQ